MNPYLSFSIISQCFLQPQKYNFHLEIDTFLRNYLEAKIYKQKRGNFMFPTMTHGHNMTE